MKVLFVCTGNTCRSPMAEAIFNNKVQGSNLKAESAGLSILPGSIASRNSATLVGDKLKIDISSRRAQSLMKNHLESNDIILTMTNRISDIIKKSYPQYTHKIFSLKEYVGVEGEISDPYGGTIKVYEKTYDELNEIIAILLAKIEGDSNL